MNRLALFSLILAAALAGLPPGDGAKGQARAPQSAAWRFVLPPPGDSFEAGKLHAETTIVVGK
jgi:hypothetical protein